VVPQSVQSFRAVVLQEPASPKIPLGPDGKPPDADAYRFESE
jgi:hypothetical protein